MKSFEVKTGVFLKKIFESYGNKGSGSPSLRSVAKILDLSAPYLSQLLNAQRRLTVQTATRIASRLSISAQEHEMLMLLVERENASDASYKKELNSRLVQQADAFVETDAEMFRVLHEWYHIPILEMTLLTDTDVSPSYVAKRLGISLVEASLALGRLERLGMLQKDAAGKYIKIESRCVFRTSRQDEAFSSFLGQMAELGCQAIDRPPLNERIASTYTLPIDRQALPDIRVLVRDFIEKIIALSSKYPQATDVFQLNLQCFNLTDGKAKRLVTSHKNHPKKEKNP